ncbi:Sec1 domain-containing protein 2 [Borealophlyctis nickersoniae]|nr:Sec1 domain-containing protein 2 [Borealophlyctis nickersoniae]
MANLSSALQGVWVALNDTLSGAVVYADDAILSTIKWSAPGGFAGLFQRGLVNVKRFEQDPPSDEETFPIRLPDPPKVVFLLTAHISRHASRLRDIILRGRYVECHIISTLSEDSHILELASDPSLVGVWGDSPGDGLVGYFPRIEATVYGWLNETLKYVIGNTFDNKTARFDSLFQFRVLNEPPSIHSIFWDSYDEVPADDLIVSVEHRPLICSMITNDFFVIPSPSVFPSLDQAEGTPLRTSAEDLSRPSVSYESNIRQLAFSLIAVLDTLGLRDELFALGETSKQLARCIVAQSSSSARRKAEGSIAVVLIDRTLDLVSPTMHTDNLLDQMYTVLPRITPTSLDLAVAPELLLSDPEFQSTHGCDEETMDLFNVLTVLAQKDSLVVVRKRLLDLISQEQIDFKAPRILGKVTLPQLQKFLAPFRGVESVLEKRASVLQVLAAAIQTLEDSAKTRWDELTGIEKIMLFSLSETSDPTIATQQIKDVLSRTDLSSDKTAAANLSTDASAHFSLHDVILLTIFSYSLVGQTLHISDDDEMALKDAFYNVLVRHVGDSEDPTATRVKIQQWISNFFMQLHAVSTTRSRLEQFKYVFKPGATPPYQSLIKQVVSDIARPSRPAAARPAAGGRPGMPAEPEDLTHVPYGGTLGTVFSGFSRLLGATRPHPSQHQSVLVFVVGGITFAEVREVKEAFRNRDVNVLVGSTDIGSSETILRHLVPAPPIGLS